MVISINFEDKLTNSSDNATNKHKKTRNNNIMTQCCIIVVHILCQILTKVPYAQKNSHEMAFYLQTYSTLCYMWVHFSSFALMLYYQQFKVVNKNYDNCTDYYTKSKKIPDISIVADVELSDFNNF